MRTKVSEPGHISCQLAQCEDDVNGSLRCQSDGITWEMNPEGIISIILSIGKVHLFNPQKRL